MIITLELVAEAIFTVNHHAKTSSYPHAELYQMKSEILKALIRSGHARKVGLDVCAHPRTGEKRTLASVKVGNYYFHTTPTKNDLEYLPYIKQGRKHYNPRNHMALELASYVIRTYLKNQSSSPQNKPHGSSSITSIKEQKKQVRGISQWIWR